MTLRRFSLPDAAEWKGAIDADTRRCIETAVLAAIAQATSRISSDALVTRSFAERAPEESFTSDRASMQGYVVPSYDARGRPVTVALAEDDAAPRNEFFGRPPPFNGAVVMTLPGNQYVRVESRHYVTTTDLTHAVRWGRLLYGTTAFVILSRRDPRSRAALYDVAGLSEPLTARSLDVRPHAAPEFGFKAIFAGRVLPEADGQTVEAIYSADRGRTAPSTEAFTDFGARLREAGANPTAPLDATVLRGILFGTVDALIASGDDDDIERAAALLAELDAVAFAMLDPETRRGYVEILVCAWTGPAVQRALIELFKSAQNADELTRLMGSLRDGGGPEQLFDDLDGDLWSLFVAVGEKFGSGKAPSSSEFLDIVMQGSLLSSWPESAASLQSHLTPFEVAELYEAGRSLVRFVGTSLEGLRLPIAHPDQVIDAVDQVMKMLVTLAMARAGHRPSLQSIAQALASVSRQMLAAMAGICLLHAGPQAKRRVHWILIWEVASWFVGVGEIKAVLSGVEIGAHLGAAGRLLGIFRGAERIGNAERSLAALQQFAKLAAQTDRALGDEARTLALLSRMAGKNTIALADALERLYLDDTTDLVHLAKADAEIARALGTANALARFSELAGGLSDDVAEAVAVISSHAGMSPTEMQSLVLSVAPGHHGRFARLVRSAPHDILGSIEPRDVRSILNQIAGEPRRLAAMERFGWGAYRRLWEIAVRDETLLDALLQATADLERYMLGRSSEFRDFLARVERRDADALRKLRAVRRAREDEPRLDPGGAQQWLEDLGVGPEGTSGTDPAERSYTRAQPPRRPRSGDLRQLAAHTAIEAAAGVELEDLINARLPPPAHNTRKFDVGLAQPVEPDHLLPGRRMVLLDSHGDVTTGPNGTPFSAQYVGDSKHRDFVRTDDQVRGFVRLAAYSDERRLLFYMRWQAHFPPAERLSAAPHGVGYVLPNHLLPELVQAGVRDEAARRGVIITIVSDPGWL